MAFLVFFILFEIVIFITEALLYNWYFKRKKRITNWKPIVYALTANSVSFALGLGLSSWIPGIF